MYLQEENQITKMKTDMSNSRSDLIPYDHPGFIPDDEYPLFNNLYELAEYHSQYISGINDSLYAMYAWLECGKST